MTVPISFSHWNCTPVSDCLTCLHIENCTPQHYAHRMLAAFSIWQRQHEVSLPSGSLGYTQIQYLLSAGEHLAPIEIDLGLARFCAMSRLDLLSCCDGAATQQHASVMTRRAPSFPMMALTLAAVLPITTLAPTLQKLRLAFRSDEPVCPT